MDVVGSQRCWVSRSFVRIRVWRGEIHLSPSHGKSCRVSSVIRSELRDLEERSSAKATAGQVSSKLALLFHFSRKRNPNSRKGEAGKQAQWGKSVSSKERGCYEPIPNAGTWCWTSSHQFWLVTCLLDQLWYNFELVWFSWLIPNGSDCTGLGKYLCNGKLFS